MNKKIVAVLVAGAIVSSTIAGCGGIKGTEKAITIGDEVVTADVANFYARYQQALYETYYGAYYGEGMWNMEIDAGKDFEDSVKETLQDNLTNLYLMDLHKGDYDISLSDDEEQAISDAAKAFVDANDSNVRDVISGTEDAAKRLMELLTIEKKMNEAMTADVDTNVSDEEAAQKSMQYVAFQLTKKDDSGNTVDLTDEEKADLLNTAKEFQTGALTAEDFSAYAQGAGYEAQTVTFDAESTSPSATVIAEADKLGEGAVSEVIEDTDAYYVVKLTSLLDRTATDNKKDSIVSQRKADQISNLLKEWKDATKVDVDKKVWKKISFEDLGVKVKDTSTDSSSDGTQETADENTAE